MYIGHLEILFHIEKKKKYIDNYRCYEEKVISSFVLKNQLDELNPKHDTVAAILNLFLLFIYLGAAALDDLCP